MTLSDAMRALLGDGSVLDDRAREFDLLVAADTQAADVHATFGVLYSGEQAGPAGAQALIERLAREHAEDPDLLSMIPKLDRANEPIAWQDGVAPVGEVMHWYAQPHMRAAYYVGLAIGWRAARQSGGA
jgi:hypothetical protein